MQVEGTQLSKPSTHKLDKHNKWWGGVSLGMSVMMCVSYDPTRSLSSPQPHPQHNT